MQKLAAKEQRVVLLRHAETAWSVSGRHTGRTDIELTTRGRRSLQPLRRWLEYHPPDQVWTSPLRRARQTCEALGVGHTATVHDELVEWDYGRYEGLTYDQIDGLDPHWDLWRGGAPGGESPLQVRHRIDRLVERLRTPPGGAGGDLLIVAHGHSLRALGIRWLGLPLEVAGQLRLSPGALAILGWHRGSPTIVAWNLEVGAEGTPPSMP